MKNYRLTGKVDSTEFFKFTYQFFGKSKNAILYIECAGPSDEVVALYKPYLCESEYLPRRNILWPRSVLFSCNFTEDLCNDLMSFSLNHAEQEYVDHLFLYENDSKVLEWCDAFLSPFYVSTEIPLTEIQYYSSRLGLEIER